MVYYGIFGLLICLVFFELYIKNKRNSIFITIVYLFIVYVILVLIAGLRKDIGIDYISYHNEYIAIQNGYYSFSGTDMEKGYFILNKIIWNFNLMLFIIAFISITTKFVIIKKYSEYIMISILLYFSMYYFTTDMGTIRQGLAMAICMYSYRYILDEKRNNFIVCNIIAAFFHYTSLVFIISYYFTRRKYSMKTMILISVSSFFVAFSNIGHYFIELIIVLLPKYSYYLNSVQGIHVINISMISRIVLLIFFIYVVKKRCSEDKNANIVLNMYFIGTCIFYLFKSFMLFSTRGSAYFNVFEILMWPIVIKNMRSIFEKYAIIIIIILYSFLNFNISVKPNHEDIYNQPYIPYKSVLNVD